MHIVNCFIVKKYCYTDILPKPVNGKWQKKTQAMPANNLEFSCTKGLH